MGPRAVLNPSRAADLVRWLAGPAMAGQLALGFPVSLPMQAAPGASQGGAATPAAPAPTPAPTAPEASADAPVGSITDQGPVLTLEEALRNARQNQPLIRQARAAADAADGRVEQARSGYLPQVTANGLVQTTTGNFAPRPGVASAGAGGPTFTLNPYFSFGVTATQLIYDFGLTYEKWRAAEAGVDSLRASERTTENQILLNARVAYFTARAQRALTKVADETLANQRRHLAQIEGFVRVGTHPAIDLATARTAVANARVTLITTENAYEIAKAQLNQAMGVVTATTYQVADDGIQPVDGEDLPTDQLLHRAIAQRPELEALERTRLQTELTVRSLRGAYGPVLAATSTATEAGTNLGGLVPNWNAGLTLTWPLFQGGLTRGQVREAEANLRGVEAQTDALRLQVRLDVETARLAVRAAKAAISAAGDALANARDQLRLAEGRYSTGVGSVIELGDAQVALSTAAAQAVNAEYNLSTARTQLLAALGQR